MMKKVNKALEKKELQNLSSFLSKGQYISLTELHGFLTAVISSPNLIMPSEWLEAVGLNDIEFSSNNEAEIIMTSILRFYNQIAQDLSEKRYHPLLSINEIKSFDNVEEILNASAQWAHGYMDAVSWNDKSWGLDEADESVETEDKPDELGTLLFLIISLIMNDDDLRNELKKNGNDLDLQEFRVECFTLLPSAVLGIYELWRNVKMESSSLLPKQTKHKAGRNDPCPCGSNKKYKRCCGNSME